MKCSGSFNVERPTLLRYYEKLQELGRQHELPPVGCAQTFGSGNNQPFDCHQMPNRNKIGKRSKTGKELESSFMILSVKSILPNYTSSHGATSSSITAVGCRPLVEYRCRHSR